MQNAPVSRKSVVIMGVSGSGKSTVGSLLAQSATIPFIDADDLHPPSNRDKMRAGIPLTDADRAPWLAAVAERLRAQAPCVVACSALTERYREILAPAGAPHLSSIPNEIQFVWLNPPRRIIEDRLRSRRDHFFPATLLQSQFDLLEPPRNALVITNDQPPKQVVAALREQLGW